MTKGAIGNLANRYRAVLKKCRLINTFGSLAVAAMLVMGGANDAAIAQSIGYDVTSTQPAQSNITVDDNSNKADARAINAFAEGSYSFPDIELIMARAAGIQGAHAYGVLAESSTGLPLAVSLEMGVSSSINAYAATQERESLSYGIYSWNNSTVTVKDSVSVTSYAFSQNGDSTSYGILSGQNSNVVLSGEGQMLSAARTNADDTDVYSYGMLVERNSSVTVSNRLDIAAQADAAGKDPSQLVAYGINAESDSSVILNYGSIHAEVQHTEAAGTSTAYGVSLGGNSSFSMQEGSIVAIANTDPHYSGGTDGDAVGIMTNSGGDSYKISLGTVNVDARGRNASGMELAHAELDMAGGTIIAQTSTGQAMGVNANSQTTFTGTGDIDLMAYGRTGSAVGLHAEGNSSITVGGGLLYSYTDDGNATGLEADSGGSITKTGGEEFLVYSLTGNAIGLDAKDSSSASRYPASKITYGNADGTSQILVVAGGEAYGIRAENAVDTSDGQSATVELMNGNIYVAPSLDILGEEGYYGDTAMGAYSVSGNIDLKGTTSIIASADGAPAADVYSLYATGDKPSAINVERASVIEGDMATATNNASVTAVFQDGGKMKGWTRSLGKLELTFGKNAVWEMVSSNHLAKGNDGNYAANLTKLALDDAHVYVGNTQGQWEAGPGFSSSKALLSATDAPAKLKIGTLSGSGHFYLRTDMEKDISDSVHVTDGLSGNHALHVQASGAEPVKTQTASYLARAEQQVGAGAGAFSLKGGRNVNGQEMIDIGLYNYTLKTSERNNGREWYLARVGLPDPEAPSNPGGGDMPLSPTGEAEAALSGLAGHYALWYGQQTDLRKRLDEIRYGAQTGLWARGFADRARLDGFAGTSFTQNTYGGSIGYDKLVSGDETYMWMLGMQLRGARADQHVNGHWGGHGDLTSIGGGLYSTWAHTDGWYVDAVGTIDWYTHKIRATMLDGTRVHDDRSSYGLGASLEAGRKFDFGYSNDNRDYWFVEPQLQLSYFWIKGGDFTASNGMKIDQEDMDSLTGRAGVVLGKKFSLGSDPNDSRYVQPYIKAGVNHEFLGEQVVHINNTRMDSDLAGTRVYYGAGIDWQATDSLRVYAQVEREHGEHFTREINVSAGLKWEF